MGKRYDRIMLGRKNEYLHEVVGNMSLVEKVMVD